MSAFGDIHSIIVKALKRIVNVFGSMRLNADGGFPSPNERKSRMVICVVSEMEAKQ
ncbi:hypothetical protein [Pontiella sulfatireligans]|uniref:Uncharacterized protein n=1 Tax=Pontiella sulfatireligans TaxID=2750658 RepID=A0A6C2UN70_9BACT|nr:hypothetical protein [Pontiella sulfatireligans]VGO21712.1 hypothetical protein SCARR_03786 [Pontiella sulfatireligans]